METSMAEETASSVRSAKMSAAFSATDHARSMALAIGGPRPFGDTKESYCARLARRLALTPRRVRALLNNEKIRLSADEYVRILALHDSASQSVASLQRLASEADVRAGFTDRAEG
jgi:plasmid maintenance system antidote protein VapI